jgi:hypothetical protein
MTTEYGWEKLYQAAVLETDWSVIEEQIDAAEGAINDRLLELSRNNDGTPEENEAITNAATALKNLRNEVATSRLKRG